MAGHAVDDGHSITLLRVQIGVDSLQLVAEVEHHLLLKLSELKIG